MKETVPSPDRCTDAGLVYPCGNKAVEAAEAAIAAAAADAAAAAAAAAAT